MKKILFLFLILPCLLTFSKEKQQPILTVSIPPQAFLIKNLVHDIAIVETLVPPGVAAETYAPKPSQLINLAKSQAFFKIGFSFEDALLPKVTTTCPNLAIIDMRHNVKLIKMLNHAHDGIPCSCGNSPYDPHIWVSPKRMIDVAKSTAFQLYKLFPEDKSKIQKNLQSLLKELQDLDTYITSVLAPYKNYAFYIYHPGFGYFAHDYFLQQVALEINGKAPSAKQMTFFMKQAREKNIKVIFVQKEFASNSAQVLANAINASVIQVENLSEDYLRTTKETADKIASALKKQTESAQ